MQLTVCNKFQNFKFFMKIKECIHLYYLMNLFIVNRNIDNLCENLWYNRGK